MNRAVDPVDSVGIGDTTSPWLGFSIGIVLSGGLGILDKARRHQEQV